MRRLLILPLCLLLTGGLLAQKKKKKKPEEEPRPQVLEVIPEPPEAIIAEPGRLSFQVSPLSDKGLLSQQVHDALKALARLNHGVPILKLRAFVAGSATCAASRTSSPRTSLRRSRCSPPSAPFRLALCRFPVPR